MSVIYVNEPGKKPRIYYGGTSDSEPVPETLDAFPEGTYYSEREVVSTTAEHGPDTVVHGKDVAVIDYGHAFDKRSGKLHQAEIRYTYYTHAAKKALQASAYKLLGGDVHPIPSNEDEALIAVSKLFRSLSNGAEIAFGYELLSTFSEEAWVLSEAVHRILEQSKFGRRLLDLDNIVGKVDKFLEDVNENLDKVAAHNDRVKQLPAGTATEVAALLEEFGWKPPSKADPELDEAVASLGAQDETEYSEIVIAYDGNLNRAPTESIIDLGHILIFAISENGTKSQIFRGDRFDVDQFLKTHEVPDGSGNDQGYKVVEEGTPGATAQITQDDADRLFGPGTRRAFTIPASAVPEPVKTEGDVQMEAARAAMAKNDLAIIGLAQPVVGALRDIGLRTIGDLPNHSELEVYQAIRDELGWDHAAAYGQVALMLHFAEGRQLGIWSQKFGPDSVCASCGKISDTAAPRECTDPGFHSIGHGGGEPSLYPAHCISFEESVKPNR